MENLTEGSLVQYVLLTLDGVRYTGEKSPGWETFPKVKDHTEVLFL